MQHHYLRSMTVAAILLLVVIPLQGRAVAETPKQPLPEARVQSSPQNTIQGFSGSIDEDALTRLLTNVITNRNVPGLSFALINDGQIVYEFSSGVRNTDTSVPINEKTLFDAASMSKTVFSAFALKMVDEGLITLDTPLYKYMPYPDIANDERYKKITTRMALSHTTGFPNWRFLNDKGHYVPDNPLTIAFEPGTQYQYSGEGFQYLARVFAHLLETNVDGLQQIIDQTLLRPLNMRPSCFIWNGYLQKHRADGHRQGKPDAGWSISEENPHFNAAASLQTNARFYARFLIGLFHENYLSQDSYKAMTTVQSEKLNDEGKRALAYGLGLYIEDIDGRRFYQHGGFNGAASGLFRYSEARNVGYVFFTNSPEKDIIDKRIMTFINRQT